MFTYYMLQATVDSFWILLTAMFQKVELRLCLEPRFVLCNPLVPDTIKSHEVPRGKYTWFDIDIIPIIAMLSVWFH